MNISRRAALSILAGAPALLSRKSLMAQAAPQQDRRHLLQPTGLSLEIAPGPFKGTRESLRGWHRQSGRCRLDQIHPHHQRGTRWWRPGWRTSTAGVHGQANASQIGEAIQTNSK